MAAIIITPSRLNDCPTNRTTQPLGLSRLLSRPRLFIYVVVNVDNGRRRRRWGRRRRWRGRRMRGIRWRRIGNGVVVVFQLLAVPVLDSLGLRVGVLEATPAADGRFLLMANLLPRLALLDSGRLLRLRHLRVDKALVVGVFRIPVVADRADIGVADVGPHSVRVLADGRHIGKASEATASRKETLPEVILGALSEAAGREHPRAVASELLRVDGHGHLAAAGLARRRRAVQEGARLRVEPHLPRGASLS